MCALYMDMMYSADIPLDAAIKVLRFQSRTDFDGESQASVKATLIARRNQVGPTVTIHAFSTAIK